MLRKMCLAKYKWVCVLLYPEEESIKKVVVFSAHADK